jgi:ribose transport system ATP-binding protein
MLELNNITKYYTGVKALDNVSMSFEPGEIHALLGENGAGKSTLIKIICGVHAPDEGAVILNGRKLHMKSYMDAVKNEISTVNQEIQVVSGLSVAENMMMDKMITFGKTGMINWKATKSYAEKYLNEVGLNISSDTAVGTLSAAQKQLVQIAKALASNSKILLLDEPTSSITVSEARILFSILQNLKAANVTIIYVTHRLEEVIELCDKVTVLRDGQYIGTDFTKNLTKEKIISMMIGRETNQKHLGQLEIDWNNKVLEAKDICQKGRFENINFTLCKGEILGFCGLVGSGRTELARILIGEDVKDSGEIFINQKKAKIKSVADAIKRFNLGYITENRKEGGLILSHSVKTNITITIWDSIRIKVLRAINIKKENNSAKNMIEALAIKVTGPDQIVRNLSGGNQQKVSIAKWLAADCDILIIDEPTVGIDVGAKEQIHKIIWELAKIEGKSIILISSDMVEMVNLARRILVFRENKIVGEINDLHINEEPYEEVSKKIGSFLV